MWRGWIARRELRRLKRAAQETCALKETKDKLEKQLEELTWRLQLEKRLRTDFEEAKAQELIKYQNYIESLQNKLGEANAMAVKEIRAAREANDEAPAFVEDKEIVIEDTKKIEFLNEQVGVLKAMLRSEKKRADDIEKYCEERCKKLEETEKKVVQLQESMSRLEEKLNNLESENKVFCHQVVSMAPNKFLSGRSRSNMQRNDSGGTLNVAVLLGVMLVCCNCCIICS